MQPAGGVGTWLVAFMIAAFLFPLFLFFGGDRSIESSPENDSPDETKASTTQVMTPPPSKAESDPVALDTISSPEAKLSSTRNPTKVSSNSETTSNDYNMSSSSNPNNNDNNWRCACEGGFLPPGLLQTFGGAEAVLRMSSGQCYHKQT
jgi:hypothetical protein